MVKGHVNNTGKLLAKLKDAEATGSPWQQTAIKRIEPLLKEMADNANGHRQAHQRQQKTGPTYLNSRIM